MIEIHFKIEDGSSEEAIRSKQAAVTGFFAGLLGEQQIKGEVLEVKTSEPKKAPAPKKPAPKKTRAAAKKKAPEKEESEISYEELADQVSKKVQELKDSGDDPKQIIAIMKEFGANKMDELDEEHYADFLDQVLEL